MREIKFRYIYMNKLTKKVRTIIKTLNQLENEGFPMGYIFKFISTDQFTGLLDKNGNEIFEGDIIYSNTYNEKVEFIGFIEFDEERCSYSINLGKNMHPLTDINRRQAKYFEVKGNIYQDPSMIP